MAADHNVIDPDQTGQRTDRQDDRQRRKSGRQERKTDHIGLARAPVPVKERGGAFPIDIAWAMHRAALGNNQIGHLAWDDCSLGLPAVTSGLFRSPDAPSEIVHPFGTLHEYAWVDNVVSRLPLAELTEPRHRFQVAVSALCRLMILLYGVSGGRISECKTDQS